MEFRTMNRRPPRLWLCLSMAALTLLLFGVCARYGHRQPAAQTHTFGRFSIQQLSSRIAAINRLLIPPGRTLWQTVQEQFISQGEGDGLHHIWAVDYEDTQHSSLVCM